MMKFVRSFNDQPLAEPTNISFTECTFNNVMKAESKDVRK